MTMGPAIRRQRQERGSVAVEYGIVLPAFLVLVLGMFDTAHLIWSQTTLDRAVEAAARCAAVDTVRCANVAAVQGVAVQEAYGLTVEASAFTVTAQACGVRVTADYPFQLVVPWIARTDMTLTAEACYPV